MIVVVPSEAQHCVALATVLRQCDRDEVAAASGQDALGALQSGLDVSAVCWTALEDGEPLCMFGVGAASILSDVGAPWMLAAEGVERHGRHLVGLGRRFSVGMLDIYPRLENYVDERNVTAQRWLERIGYDVGEPEPYGVDGLPFRKFSMGVC